MMKNFKLTIQYDGTEYNGWQRQKNTSRTIQQRIEKALKKILQQRVVLTGSGRTDTGVHAQAQVANFKINRNFVPDRLLKALNSLLPPDIRITHIQQVAPGFHSRYDVKEKTYRYTILNQSYNDVFLRRCVYHYSLADLDVKKMQQAARFLVGRHDFSSFKITGDSLYSSNIRNIKKLSVSKKDNYIFIDVAGDGFLHKMIRGIVGTLIEIGRGKLELESLKKILSSKNRKSAGPTAPACGLCLLKVKY
jgi:tRNA pseudouridine38-40 synthase